MNWLRRIFGKARRRPAAAVPSLHVLGAAPPPALPLPPQPLDVAAFLERMDATQDDEARIAVLAEGLKILPPADMQRLYTHLARHYRHGIPPPDIRKRAPLFKALTRGRAKPPHYRALTFGPYATLYRAPRGEPRSLLICFTGRNHHLFSHVSLFLHGVGGSGLDLMVLRHAPGADYRTGVPGIAGNLHGIATALPRLLALDDYARVSTFGVSMGGLAAISVAETLGADFALAVGALFPRAQDPARLARSGPAFDRFCSSVRPRPVPTALIHGTEDPLDRQTAERLAQWNPKITRIPVEGAGHNPLQFLAAQGRRDAFFAALRGAARDGRNFTAAFATKQTTKPDLHPAL